MLDEVGPRQLVLVRHAQAEPEGAGGSGDLQRELTTRGRGQCVVLAALLRAAGLAEPDLVLVSSARRAQQTWAALLEEQTGRPIPGDLATGGVVVVEDGLYEASATALVHRLADVPDDVRLLVLVGHEPVVSETAVALAGKGSDGQAVARVRTGAATASATVLQLSSPWASLAGGACRLSAYLVP